MSRRGGGGGFGGGGMQQLMQQAQAMQENMKKAQEEVEQKTVEADAGNGLVTVVISGKQVLEEITIKPDCVDPEDVEMLQDLIQTAINDGVKKSQEMVEEAMSKVTGGMNIPGMF